MRVRAVAPLSDFPVAAMVIVGAQPRLRRAGPPAAGRPSCGGQAEMAVPLGAGPGLKPFACLRFLRTPEGVLPRIEIRGFYR